MNTGATPGSRNTYFGRFLNQARKAGSGIPLLQSKSGDRRHRQPINFDKGVGLQFSFNHWQVTLE
jgi:hypothetical protein